MTRFFAFVAAVALAITFSSCASKKEPMQSSSMSSTGSTTYSK